MFGDPWGGWSYGARYLIPSSAILSAGIAPVIDKFRKNYFFAIVFFIITLYSLYVNVLGAYTTNAIPPKIEAENLVTPIPYTYKYNENLLEKNLSGSLVYNIFLNKFISSEDDIVLITILLFLIIFYFYGKGELIPSRYLSPSLSSYLPYWEKVMVRTGIKKKIT